MSSHLFRRGGIWWARLAVPERLRAAAGRREFIQSCKTHELQIAKLVTAVLVADWRRQLLALQFVAMPYDVLKIVDGPAAFVSGGHLPLEEAADLFGVSLLELLRAAAAGRIRLHCRLSWAQGVVVPMGVIGLQAVFRTPFGKCLIRESPPVIPARQDMPECVYENSVNGINSVFMSREVAEEVLASRLKEASIRLFDHDDSHVFVTDQPVTVMVERFEVLVAEVDALRQRMAASVSPKHLEQARITRTMHVEGSVAHAGKRAQKLFSEALEAYASTPSGIPGSVASLAEQKQKRRGCSLFIELVGDLPLKDVTADRLREFRGKLKTLPAKVNNIKKEYRRDTMAATVIALKDGGVKWPMMTENAQYERMQWVDQMFRWLVTQEWLQENPMASVLVEQTKTAAERKAERQVKAQRKAEGVEDDSDDREPFAQEELSLIFGQTHYQAGNGAHVKGNARWYPFEYWLPIIALHAGCRIKEVSQLHLSDIRQSAEGVWYFDINEITPDKSLKNENATRQIPMSPVLIDLGLIAYRDRLKAEGFLRLFPELSWAMSDAKYAKEPVRKMSLMFSKLGMPRDGTKVFHCLRSNFNDAMLRVPVANLPFDNPKLVVFAQMKIFGHMVEDVNGKHYTSAAMAEKLLFVSGIRYDLPEIAKFDIDFGIQQVRVAIENKEGFRCGREDMGPLNDE